MKRVAMVNLEFDLSDEDRDQYHFMRISHFRRPSDMPLVEYMKIIRDLDALIPTVVLQGLWRQENEATSHWFTTLENQGLNGSGEDELDSAR